MNDHDHYSGFFYYDINFPTALFTDNEMNLSNSLILKESNNQLESEVQRNSEENKLRVRVEVNASVVLDLFVSFLLSWRKFWIRGAPSERPEFPSLSVFMISGRVQIRLAEDDHPDVCMQIDLPGLGACNSEMNEISQPLLSVWVGVRAV